ncbi:hypothetical protein CN392_17895 [Bacillus cereus]|nr:hypothetical protein CN392_17895 [Bacillus cereus]
MRRIKLELLYVWIEKFRNLEKQSITLSNSFDINYINKVLTIKKRKSPLKLFEHNIINVTAVVGKNGSGKTNFLDALALGPATTSFTNKGSKYFLIYKLKDDKFLIECSTFNLLNNVEFVSSNEEDMRPVFSIVAEYDDTKEVFKQNYFLQNKEEKDKIVYFNIRNGFRNGYNELDINSDDSSDFRRYNLNREKIHKKSTYKFLLDCNKKSLYKDYDINYHNINLMIKNNLYVSFDKDSLKVEENSDNNLKNALSENDSALEKQGKFIHKLLRDYTEYTYQELRKRSKSVEKHKIKLNKLFYEMKNELEKQSITGNDKIKYYFALLDIMLRDYFSKFDNSEEGTKYFIEIKKLINILLKLDEKYFINLGLIRIPISEPNESIMELLGLIDENIYSDRPNYINDCIIADFGPTSSGEEAYLNLMSSIHSGFEKYQNLNGKNIILLLDEPDNYMHPEWSRTLVTILNEYLNNNYPLCNFQIIMTTHSPFIISDLPRRNVVAFRKNEENGKGEVLKNDFISETFASNIHTLLSESFFMNATIGEFSKIKINKIINTLIEKEDMGNNPVDIEYIENVIRIIGEPLLKSKLTEMLDLRVGKEKNLEEILIDFFKESQDNDSDRT